MHDAYLVSDLFYGFDKQLFEGGMEIHLRDISEILIECGLKVCVLQRWPNNETIFDDDGLTVEGMRTNKFLLSLAWRKRIKGNPQIIHLNSLDYSFPSASIDTSITFHGVGWDIPKNIPKKYVEPFYGPKVRAIRAFEIGQMMYGMTKSSKIITVDTSLLRLIQQLSPDNRDKVHYIPNYVDTTLFSPTRSTKSNFGIGEDDFVILFPRNLSLARGYPILLDIIRYFSDKKKKVKFLVAGKEIKEITNAGYSQRIMKSLADMNMLGSVQFLGSVKHSEMGRAYNAADVVIIPSMFSEGTSLSAIEAMACGRPVIASNIGGLNDLIIDGYNGLIRRPNGSDFIEAINGLMNNELDAKVIGQRAVSIVGESFTKIRWNRSIRQFFEL